MRDICWTLAASVLALCAFGAESDSAKMHALSDAKIKLLEKIVNMEMARFSFGPSIDYKEIVVSMAQMLNAKMEEAL
jgi:hypothetical protein